MKEKEAKQIIESEFGDLKKEERSQYDTLVSLLVKYGADESRPLEKLKCWTQQKPDYACIFVTKHSGEYNIWRFCWEIGEPPEDETDTDETVYWYLAWTNQDGDEWDDIAECDFDEYLILELLPTMDKAHKQWCEKESKAFLSA